MWSMQQTSGVLRTKEIGRRIVEAEGRGSEHVLEHSTEEVWRHQVTAGEVVRFTLARVSRFLFEATDRQIPVHHVLVMKNDVAEFVCRSERPNFTPKALRH